MSEGIIMYIHLGGEVTVMSDKICAVVDLETAPPSRSGIAAFIASEDDRNRLQYLTGDIPKSVIVTDDRTYLSSMSAGTIRKRINSASYGIIDVAG